MSENLAVQVLKSRRKELIEGVDCIADQQNHLTHLKDSTKKAERKLAESKKELVDIDSALGILTAGE